MNKGTGGKCEWKQRERRTGREGMNKRWRGYRDGKKELGEDRRTPIRRSQKEISERRRGKELSSLVIKRETKHLGIAKTVSIVPGMYVCSGLTFLKWLLDLLSALTRAAGAKHLIGVSFKPCCSSDGFSQLFHPPPPKLLLRRPTSVSLSFLLCLLCFRVSCFDSSKAPLQSFSLPCSAR